jgi:hypothetical protein
MLHRWRIAAAVVALFLWVGVRPFAADNVTGSLPSRLSDRAFWQVAERFSGRILASHQNAAAGFTRIAESMRDRRDRRIRTLLLRSIIKDSRSRRALR